MDDYFPNRRITDLEASCEALSLEELEAEVARLGSELSQLARARPDDDRRIDATVAYQEMAMVLDLRRRTVPTSTA